MRRIRPSHAACFALGICGAFAARLIAPSSVAQDAQLPLDFYQQVNRIEQGINNVDAKIGGGEVRLLGVKLPVDGIERHLELQDKALQAIMDRLATCK